MPWKGIGVAVAVITATLVFLGSANGLVVDWAWFSTIGYVGVFWTVFSTKAVLFIAVFAVSTLLLWVNGALALRFASRRPTSASGCARPGLCHRPGIAREPDRVTWNCLFGVAMAFDHPGCRPRHRTADRDRRDR